MNCSVLPIVIPPARMVLWPITIAPITDNILVKNTLSILSHLTKVNDSFLSTTQISAYLDPGDICPTAPSWASAGGGGGGGGGTGATGGGGGGGAGDVRHPGGARSSWGIKKAM